MTREHWEEEDFGNARKEQKQERKRLQAKDRSKYKKTDLEKRKKERVDSPLGLEAVVVCISSQGVEVMLEDKTTLICSLKGILKKQAGQEKNLVTIGDLVVCERSDHDPNEGVIVAILPRKSVLIRQDNITRRKQQLIAANVDQVAITVCVVSPLLKLALIDRYIIAALKGQIQPFVVVNKIDLLEGKKEEEAQALLFLLAKEIYNSVGIEVIGVSCETGEGLEDLKLQLKDKTTVFSGQSGVGKTSLINALTGKSLKVGDVVSRTQKGSHTTSQAQLLPFSFGGFCVDTPGIRSFGIWDLRPSDVQNYFIDIGAQSSHCRFANCTHRGEEGCFMMEAVEKNLVSPLRYQSYLALLDEIDQEYLRR